MAAARRDSRAAGEGTELPPAETRSSEPGSGQTEVQQCSELPRDSGKAQPSSSGTERLFGSLWKSRGLGKVMSGRKKRDNPVGAGEAGGGDLDREQEAGRPAAQCQRAAVEECLLSLGPAAPGPSEFDSSIQEAEDKHTKRQEAEEASVEPKPLSPEEDAKPKKMERSGVRDFIRRPVSKMLSHKSTDKRDQAVAKDGGAGAQEDSDKTRSRSLDRLVDSEVSAACTDRAAGPHAEGETPKAVPHGTGHMRRWHSFKKLMVPKTLKRATDSGAEQDPDAKTSDVSETQDRSDLAVQKRRRMKRSWTFQGLKKDQSFFSSHNQNVLSKDAAEGHTEARQSEPATSGDPRALKTMGEEICPEENDPDQAEEKGTGTHSHTKSIDQQAHEAWVSFKKLVILKSKRAPDATNEEGDAVTPATDERVGQDLNRSERQPSKRAAASRAASLKKFILRKGKSKSMDLGDTPGSPKGEQDKSISFTPAEAIDEQGMQNRSTTSKASSLSLSYVDMKPTHCSTDQEEDVESAPRGSTSENPVSTDREDSLGEVVTKKTAADAEDTTQEHAQDYTDRSHTQDPKLKSNTTEPTLHSGSKESMRTNNSESKTPASLKVLKLASAQNSSEKEACESLQDTLPDGSQESERGGMATETTEVRSSHQAGKRTEEKADDFSVADTDDATLDRALDTEGGLDDLESLERAKTVPRGPHQAQGESEDSKTFSRTAASSNEGLCSDDTTAKTQMKLGGQVPSPACPAVQTSSPEAEQTTPAEEGDSVKTTEEEQTAGGACCSSESPQPARSVLEEPQITEGLNDQKLSGDQDTGSCDTLQHGGEVNRNGNPLPGLRVTQPDVTDPQEEQKRMFYEAAAAIVQTVVSAATEQIVKEQDLLDNGLKGPSPSNNDSCSYQDLDQQHCS
uniref:A-kinase anchor protein 12-like n=1 Tax=Lepisosteus oculatus TaxID=7918 RepID=W5NMG7_LEPOC|nr:PREDICTED: A-kinase anchor protein 12-like [Lepisosteus oculatus]